MAVTVRTLENFVGGEWVPSTGDSAREIVSPVNGATLAEAPNASVDDLDRAVAAARAAQPKWAALSAWDRAKVCHAIADLIGSVLAERAGKRENGTQRRGADVRGGEDRAAQKDDGRRRLAA